MDYGRRFLIVHNNTNNKLPIKLPLKISKKMILIGVLLIAIIVILIIIGRSSRDATTFAIVPVERGNLVVEVLESGSIAASESLDIRSKVEGRTTIISIIPEGTIITEEDVKNKKVLVELDSAELRKKLDQQEITVEKASAELTDAQESYNIQVNKNESNLKEGELKVKFAKMDLDKYLGEKVADLFTSDIVTLSDLIDHENLGGEALQKKREQENTISLAEEELARAEEKVIWTAKLEEKGYVTQNELQADELAVKQKDVGLEKAKTAYDLFKKYELIKQAEKLRSDYEQAKKELERVIAQNRSELSRALAKLRSAEANLKSQSDQLDKLKEQLVNCKIYATKPGLVLYGDSESYFWSRDQIKEGAEVRERQIILNIPETTSMIAKTKVHESMINRVKEGLPVEITIDAIPDRIYTGKVKKVSHVPDSEQRWMNPNLKVYITEVSLNGRHEELKPGMSAQIRIICDELKNVLLVPLQAITTEGDNSICFVMASSVPEKRVITTGDYNDKFMEIKDGLKEGEKIVLNIAALADKIKPATESEKEKKKIYVDSKSAEDITTSTAVASDGVTTSPENLKSDSTSTTSAIATP